jgi:hypothetical protein
MWGALEPRTHRRMGCLVGRHGVVTQVVASAAKIRYNFRIWGSPYNYLYGEFPI